MKSEKEPSRCRLCRQGNVIQKISLGRQPIGNRFLSNLKELEYTFPFRVGRCDACQLIQLVQVPPVSEITPRFSWIQYNEPENHLDDLTERLCKLPGFSTDSVILGLTSKDESLLDRFRKRGHKKVNLVDPQADLEMTNPLGGIESVPENLDVACAKKLCDRYGKPKLVVARHVFEHAQDTRGFMESLKHLAGDGYLLLEVPDCSKAIKEKDYTTLWEEHVVYFSPQTFPGNLTQFGLKAVFSHIYPYALDDSLVAVLTNSAQTPPMIEETKTGETEDFDDYGAEFNRQKKIIRESLGRLSEKKGRVAILGAGHLTTAFINYFDLKEFVSFVVDDFPPKQGLFLPGSRLPIYPSSRLMENGLMSCLLGIGVGNEQKIIDRNRAFVEKGGEFFSIFPGRKNSFYNMRSS